MITLANVNANSCRPFLTVAVAWKFWAQFAPLSEFIALRVIDRDRRSSHVSQTVDEEREKREVYGHPSMFEPLEPPWTPFGPLTTSMM